MRYIFIFFLSLLFINNTHSQRPKNKGIFSFSVGLNAIDNNGEQNILSLFSEAENIAFSNPFEFFLNYGVDDNIEIYAGGTLNKYKKGQNIDGRTLYSDVSTSSFDFGIRYYVWDIKSYKRKRIRLYTHGGFSYNNIYTSYVTANLGGGITFDVNRGLSVYLNTVSKFSTNNAVYKSNLFQHSIGLRLKLFDNNCDCSL